MCSAGDLRYYYGNIIVRVQPLTSADTADPRRVLWLKLLVIVYGIVTVLLGFCAHLAGSLLQVSMTILGIIGGPILAVFTLGILVPYVNRKVRSFCAFAAAGVCAIMTFCVRFTTAGHHDRLDRRIRVFVRFGTGSPETAGRGFADLHERMFDGLDGRRPFVRADGRDRGLADVSITRRRFRRKRGGGPCLLFAARVYEA